MWRTDNSVGLVARRPTGTSFVWGYAQRRPGAQTRHSEPHLTRPVASKRRRGGERMSKSDGGPVSERPSASFVQQGTAGFGSSHRPADVDANQQPPDDLRLRPSMGARP